MKKTVLLFSVFIFLSLIFLGYDSSMLSFQAQVEINQPIEKVYTYVSNGETFPKWNSAVKQVQTINENPDKIGTQYSMIRDLPNGTAKNILEVTKYQPNTLFTIKVVSGPTPFTYTYNFKDTNKGTIITLDAYIEKAGLIKVLGVKGRLAPDFLLKRFVKNGVEKNLTTLKNILEN